MATRVLLCDFYAAVCVALTVLFALSGASRQSATFLQP
jgi:hypothetical protein